MALIYKFEILPALKAADYNTGCLRREKVFGETTIQKFRDNESINFSNLDKLCKLLDCQPGDILEYVPDE